MPVYKDEKRGTYYFVTRINGKQVKRRGFQSSKEAKLAEAKMLLEAENNDEKNKINEDKISFTEVANEYLKWYQKRRKNSSYTKISSIVNTHLIPRFKNKRLSSIRNKDITDLQNDLIESGAAVSHIKKIHTTLSAIFNFAIKQEYIETNPASTVGNIDLKEEKKMDYWTLEEFKRFISVIDNDFYLTLFMTLYYSGMRKGELLAITWNDINFEENTIHINKTVYNNIITTPKTSGSIRTITMPTHTMRLLSLLRASKEYYKPDYIVFGDFYKPLSTSTLDRYFAKYIKESGVKKIRIHDLRHSHASYLINKGTIISVIAKRLGHSNPSTTLNIYSHLYPSTEKEAVLQMEDDFKPAKIYKIN